MSNRTTETDKLGTYIVQVTKSINVQDISETWCQTEVLDEAREHMPWVTLEEGLK
jgi:hypothetical protein